MTSSSASKEKSVREILVVAISSPILIGVYEDGALSQTFSLQKHASEALIDFLAQVANEPIASVTYANGPGSFMGLKVAYTTLKTFCDARGVELFAASGFEFCSAIKSNGGFCFTLNAGEVRLEKRTPSEVVLPHNLSSVKRLSELLPNYILDAV